MSLLIDVEMGRPIEAEVSNLAAPTDTTDGSGDCRSGSPYSQEAQHSYPTLGIHLRSPQSITGILSSQGKESIA
jgi:hypothetical protein